MTKSTPRPSVTSWADEPYPEPHGTPVVWCSAKAKSTGAQCGNLPMRGGRVCFVHGGAAGQVRVAARRRMELAAVEAQVTDALAGEILTAVTDPLEALSMLAAEALAMKEALGVRVNALNTMRYTALGAGTEQLRSEVALYERALDRSAKFLDLLAKSGFEERRTRLQESQGALVAVGLRRIFARLDLSEAQQALIGTVVPQELRALTQEPGRG